LQKKRSAAITSIEFFVRSVSGRAVSLMSVRVTGAGDAGKQRKKAAFSFAIFSAKLPVYFVGQMPLT
jgi:hypothetical protein